MVSPFLEVVLTVALVLVQTASVEEAERLFASEDWTAAAAAYERIVEESPEDGRAWLRLGIALQGLDRHEEAVTAMSRAEQLSFLPSITRFELARSYALLDRRDEAAGWLERAVDAGFSQPERIEAEPAFRPMRGDHRFQASLEKARVNAEPCEHLPAFRQFDFWIGEWNVHSLGRFAGTNTIEKLERGCLLRESWISASGGTGTSMNYYDAVQEKWIQVWFDSSGTSIHARAELRDGEMRFEGEHHYPDGRSERFKMTFTPNDDGSVRQRIEQSRDGGESWYVWFDGIYTKR